MQFTTSIRAPRFVFSVTALEPMFGFRDLAIRLRNSADRAASIGEMDVAAHFKEQYDKIPRRIIWREAKSNLVTTQGMNDLLDKYFSGAGYTAAWYAGLINETGTPALSVGDTMASHAGWSELTAYSGANRLTYDFGAAAAGEKATQTALTFNINASCGVHGIFSSSSATKGGTTGVLYNAVAFDAPRTGLLNGDILNVIATMTAE